MHKVSFSKTLFNEETGRAVNTLIHFLEEIFTPGDTIAVKMHMGEDNNKTALASEFTRSLVNTLKSLHLNPFIFDSPVVYNSKRNTSEGYIEVAAKRGFTEEYIGCPIVVSNASIQLKGERAEYSLCMELTKADGVCVLSHVKGHPCTGFGGAIKNIGMGAMSSETKGKIHDGGKPIYNCGCTECMKCVEMCPTGNIRLVDCHPEFDRSYCIGCSNCAFVCEAGAINPAVDFFDKMLAEATALALPRMGKLFYINCLVNITELCDCIANSGKILSPDIGHIVGDNICAVERASFDLIKKRMGNDVFFNRHHISPQEHISRLQSLLDDGGEYSMDSTP